ncbi:MAG: hypothetical protein MJE66_04890 [Proteobacteria bacterium]|nr:hypothetical protein [Pseudomonadota bacterium]
MSIRRARALAPLLCLGLASCLFEPTNESELASRRESVRFRWVSLQDRAPVVLEAALRPGGPFQSIGVSVGPGVPVVINGASLFEFEAMASIPTELWRDTCDGRETFVRARGGSLILTTYDNPSIAGAEPEECIADNGGFFPFAAIACASDTPPVRLVAPGPGTTDVVGDLEIASPHQAADYACVESVDGDFVVRDESLEDLSFPALTSVTGSVELTYAYQPNASIRSIDLPSLASVGGDLQLRFPDSGSGGFSLSADFGLPALASVGGGLRLDTAAPGTTIVNYDGLPALTSLPGSLDVDANNGDNSYGGFLDNLAQVDGDVRADLGFTVTGGFGGLTTVAGDVEVSATTYVFGSNFPALSTVTGDFRLFGGTLLMGNEFAGLESVGGDLTVESSSFNLAPAPYFALLENVGGSLRFVSMTGAVAELGSVAVDVGGLVLDANDELSDLATTLSKLQVDASGPISITGNEGISDCEAQDYVDGLPGHAGPVTIADNDAC